MGKQNSPHRVNRASRRRTAGSVQGRFLGSLVAGTVVLLSPVMVRAWGTASSPGEITEAEMGQLRNLMRVAGRDNSSAFWTDFEARRGPHVIHQFIAHQAYLTLKTDPAFKEEDFLKIEDINRWDGQFRVPEGNPFGVPSGPIERLTTRRAREDARKELNDTAWPESSPGPDAEISREGRWNPFYSGRAHYWNPWLRTGGAPDEAGGLFSQLLDALMEKKEVREQARLACYMAHYIGDVASPKHADAFEIPQQQFAAIEQTAGTFQRAARDDVFQLIDSPAVVSMERRLRAITAAAPGGANSDAYWNRVQTHIGEQALLNPGPGKFVSVVPKSIRSAVAAYLDGVGTRPTVGGDIKPMNRFFNYFDPFYFNGEVVHPSGGILFSLTTPGSAHLHYETTTTQMAWVNRNFNTTVEPKMPTAKEVGFPPIPSFPPTEEGIKQRKMAYAMAVAALTRHCSEASHGEITLAQDFNEGRFEEPMRVAIRHVAAAFRACITGLRIDARLIDAGMGVDKHQKKGIRCKFSNASDKTVRLERAVLSWSGGGSVDVEPDCIVDLGGKTLAKDQVLSHTWEVRVPEGQPMPEFKVDLYGTYMDVPDRGWARATVTPGGPRIVFGPGGAEAGAPKTGPLDLAVVFDTTGSMQKSIDSVAKQTQEVLRKLHDKCPDMRVGLVEFRDLQDKEAPALNSWDFSDPAPQIRRIGELKAKGGGDLPEDQYAGIMAAIKMKWRNAKPGETPVTKLIVVVTDASAKKPDSLGNTPEKVAKAAFDLDPAHIYPIVVGSSSEALAHAEELAKLSDGAVLTADSGDEVADKLLSAVEKGIEEHAPPPVPEEPPQPSTQTPIWLLITGGGAVLVGAGLLLGGLAAPKAAAGGVTCPKCGSAVAAGKKFCPQCGSSVNVAQNGG